MKSVIQCMSFLMIMGIFLFACNTTKPVLETPPFGPYYSGEAGEGISLTVMQLPIENLPENEQWLSSFIQGILTSDFNKYTAMTVVDRQHLDDILFNQELSMSGNFSDDNYISIGHLTNAEYILTGTIHKIQQTNSYLFSLSMINATTGEQKTSFPPTNCSFVDLQNTAIIQKAFEDIITQLDITLTARGKQAISYIDQPSIASETSFSKGKVAQRGNRIGEALSYYYNAVSFTPNFSVANNNISNLSSVITSGNIGQDARNLIALRNSWQEILTECDNFLNDHIPFEIIYDPTLKQEGEINYSSGTINLGFSIKTSPTDGFKMINDVLKGLKSTGKQDEWGVEFWPFIKPITYYSLANEGFKGDYYESLWNSSQRVFYEDKKISIEVALLDAFGQIISKISADLLCRMGTRTLQEVVNQPYEPWEQLKITQGKL